MTVFCSGSITPGSICRIWDTDWNMQYIHKHLKKGEGKIRGRFCEGHSVTRNPKEESSCKKS